jgi:hypothetical protein
MLLMLFTQLENPHMWHQLPPCRIDTSVDSLMPWVCIPNVLPVFRSQPPHLFARPRDAINSRAKAPSPDGGRLARVVRAALLVLGARRCCAHTTLLHHTSIPRGQCGGTSPRSMHSAHVRWCCYCRRRSSCTAPQPPHPLRRAVAVCASEPVARCVPLH